MSIEAKDLLKWRDKRKWRKTTWLERLKRQLFRKNEIELNLVNFKNKLLKYNFSLIEKENELNKLFKTNLNNSKDLKWALCFLSLNGHFFFIK